MSPLKALKSDRRGAVALVIAAATPVLIGSIGLSVDTIQWAMTKRLLQRQADSAAIAGAYGLAQGAEVDPTVTDDLARNDFVELTSAPVIENAPSAGAFAGDDRAVRVELVSARQLPFSRLILTEPVRIEAEATAAMVANGDYCALALETEDEVGINMTGNTTVDLRCGMATNSVAENAVNAGGSSRVWATPISAVGGLEASSNYQGTTTLIPYSVTQPDPYKGLPNPSGFTAPQNGRVNSNQTRTLNPGTYRGMSLNGNVTLNPGTYLVDGGSFSVGSQARVTGNGVVIILTSQTAGSNPNSIAQADINGGARVDLTAPTGGTYAGILFYQDRRAPMVNQTNKINGNSSSKFQGAFYFPGQELQFTGTSGMNINCIQMVARRLTFTGNSTVTNVCPPGSGAQAFTGTAIRLVA